MQHQVASTKVTSTTINQSIQLLLRFGLLASIAVASPKPKPSLFTGSAFLSLMFGYKNSRFSACQKVYAKQI